MAGDDIGLQFFKYIARNNKKKYISLYGLVTPNTPKSKEASTNDGISTQKNSITMAYIGPVFIPRP